MQKHKKSILALFLIASLCVSVLGAGTAYTRSTALDEEGCEARVKAALEAVDGVQSAAASHEAGTAVVTLKADADENALKPLLKAVVEENDYEVKGFDK